MVNVPLRNNNWRGKPRYPVLLHVSSLTGTLGLSTTEDLSKLRNVWARLSRFGIVGREQTATSLEEESEIPVVLFCASPPPRLQELNNCCERDGKRRVKIDARHVFYAWKYGELKRYAFTNPPDYFFFLNTPIIPSIG